MEDEKTTPKLKVVCAQEVLNRSLGRPIDMQVMLQVGNQDTLKDVSEMSDRELERLARSLTPAQTSKEKPMIVDAEYVKDQ